MTMQYLKTYPLVVTITTLVVVERERQVLVRVRNGVQESHARAGSAVAGSTTARFSCKKNCVYLQMGAHFNTESFAALKQDNVVCVVYFLIFDSTKLSYISINTE
jgi:hypothetical protein